MLRALLSAPASALTTVAASQAFFDQVAAEYLAASVYPASSVTSAEGKSSESAQGGAALAPTTSSTLGSDALKDSTNIPSMVVFVEKHFESAHPDLDSSPFAPDLDPDLDSSPFALATTIHILLAVSVEEITPTDIDAMKRILLDTLRRELGASTPISAIHVDIFPGSSIVRVRIFGQQGPLPQAEAQRIFSSLSVDKLAALLPGIPVAYTSWQLPSWTGWWDSDSPQSGDGDQELVSELLEKYPLACDGRPPVGLYCETEDGRPWSSVKEILDVPCSLALGGIRCLNAQNPPGCSNYRIKLDCVLLPDARYEYAIC
jgi:hypothetical protein